MTWYKKYLESRPIQDDLASMLARSIGSWNFIIIQTIFIIVWMGLNVCGIAFKWDAYPFVLLNLAFSTQAAYAAPIIMMSQKRQSDRDKAEAEEQFKTNLKMKEEIGELQKQISQLEIEKIDKIIHLLEKQKKNII